MTTAGTAAMTKLMTSKAAYGRVPSRSGVSSPIRTLSRPPPYMTAANTATEAIPTVTRPGVPTRCSPGRSDCLKSGSFSMVERNASPSTQSSGSDSGLVPAPRPGPGRGWRRPGPPRAAGTPGARWLPPTSGSRPKRSGSAPGRSLRTPVTRRSVTPSSGAGSTANRSKSAARNGCCLISTTWTKGRLRPSTPPSSGASSPGASPESASCDSAPRPKPNATRSARPQMRSCSGCL